MRERIIADVFLACLLFWAPWQWTVIAALVFIFYFSNYWEGAAAALVADAFYSLPGQMFTGGFGFFTLSSLLILYAVSFVKSKIKIF